MGNHGHKSVKNRQIITFQEQLAIIQDNSMSMKMEQLKINETLMDEDSNEDLLNNVNKLNVLQDKTASRDQFACQRKKIYQLLDQLVQYDVTSNQIILSNNQILERLTSQESLNINDLPNFPNTFPVSEQRQRLPNDDLDNEVSELESDLMDSDEMGMGVREQNERLRQMTLPVLFKNILNTQSAMSHSQQSVSMDLDCSYLIDRPLPIYQFHQSQRFQNDPQPQANNESFASESVLMIEDQPHLTALPRYFDDIIIFNQSRGILSQLQNGTSPNVIHQLPEREIDIDWVRRRGVQQNLDHKKCLICLMDYDHGEKVRTLPCLHYFHSECIDFWLSRSKHCPICKTSCDYADKY